MNYYCQHITNDLEKEWNSLSSNHPASGFHQTFAWTFFKHTQHWDSYKIGLFEEKTQKLVGGAIVLQFTFNNGSNFFYIPEGPLLNYQDEDELFWQWRALQPALFSIVNVQKNHLTTHLRIEPRIIDCPQWFLSPFKKSPLNLQPRHTQILPLTISEEEILAQMKPKCRYNIKLAAKKGVTVEHLPLTEETITRFYSIYAQTTQRNKFEGKNIDFFKHYLTTCNSLSKLFVTKIDDTDLAAVITINHGPRTTYLYGASTNKNRHLMAPYLLHWEIIKDAKAEGKKEYDFWGIHHDANDPSHPWHGITQFKKKFNGIQMSFIGAYDYIFQKDLYEEFLEKHESN